MWLGVWGSVPDLSSPLAKSTQTHSVLHVSSVLFLKFLFRASRTLYVNPLLFFIFLSRFLVFSLKDFYHIFKFLVAYFSSSRTLPRSLPYFTTNYYVTDGIPFPLWHKYQELTWSYLLPALSSCFPPPYLFLFLIMFMAFLRSLVFLSHLIQYLRRGH